MLLVQHAEVRKADAVLLLLMANDAPQGPSAYAAASARQSSPGYFFFDRTKAKVSVILNLMSYFLHIGDHGISAHF